MDSRTRKICNELDGKKFKVKDRQAGTNYPPMHPFCRSTTIAVIDVDVEDINIGDKARELAEEIGYEPLSDSEVVNVLREDSKEWIDNLNESEKSLYQSTLTTEKTLMD